MCIGAGAAVDVVVVVVVAAIVGVTGMVAWLYAGAEDDDDE